MPKEVSAHDAVADPTRRLHRTTTSSDYSLQRALDIFRQSPPARHSRTHAVNLERYVAKAARLNPELPRAELGLKNTNSRALNVLDVHSMHIDHQARRTLKFDPAVCHFGTCTSEQFQSLLAVCTPPAPCLASMADITSSLPCRSSRPAISPELPGQLAPWGYHTQPTARTLALPNLLYCILLWSRIGAPRRINSSSSHKKTRPVLVAVAVLLVGSGGGSGTSSLPAMGASRNTAQLQQQSPQQKHP